MLTMPRPISGVGERERKRSELKVRSTSRPRGLVDGGTDAEEVDPLDSVIPSFWNSQNGAIRCPEGENTSGIVHDPGGGVN